MLTDLRYAVRGLRARPGFTAAAVVVLALGIGANATLFGIVDAVVLRPMPGVERPERLAWVANVHRLGSRLTDLSYPDYADYRDASRAFAQLALYRRESLSLAGCAGAAAGECGEPARVSGEVVTGNYFATLGLRPAHGRFFLPDEDRTRGTHPVVVLSDALWRSRFAADPAVVGRQVTINGAGFTVVGVAGERFAGAELDRPAQLWVPLSMWATVAPAAGFDPYTLRVPWGSFRAIGRLADGITPAQAASRVRAVERQIRATDPKDREQFGVATFSVTGLVHPSDRLEVLGMSLLGAAVALVVLLTACANVASLLLGRAAGRRREIGIRYALGASRGRIVRQLLAESALLAVGATAVAMLLSLWLGEALPALVNAPLVAAPSPSWRTVAATAAAALVAGALFGVAPALAASRRDVLPSLVDGAAAGTVLGARRSRLQGALVAAQVALSLTLLVCAGLLVRSLHNAAGASVGFDARGDLVVASLDATTQGVLGERRAAFHRELLERVRAFPGVRAASLAAMVPLGGTMIGMAVQPEGRAEAAPGTVFVNNVWPDYFRTIGTPLVRGREIADRDVVGAPGVVVVNETAARRLWPGQDPIGQRLRLGGADQPPLEVVGVARDAKFDELNEDPHPFVFVPEAQRRGFTTPMTLLVRTDAPAGQTAAQVRSAVRAMAPSLPLYDVRTMAQVIEQRLDKQRAGRTLLALFGALAALLAAVGVYGVTAYAVAQSTREIGVRMALGASAREVLALFVGRGARLALAGVASGAVLSLGAAQVIRSSLVGVSTADPATFAAAASLLVAAAALAALIPARRAARVPPAVALRNE